jgi:hypothetical protein|tara:strand:- start:3426 stop:3599 length:174 start_codon:yes stop_codon:yes gene_type:complete
MKVKLKDKSNKLPNCWKECGCSFEDWQELQKGNSVEVSNLNNLEHLFDVPKSKKGDK